MSTSKHTAVIATFAALLALQSASAGPPAHRMPAAYGQKQPTYQLKVASAPVVGAPLVVTLINQADGQQVQGGEVTALRPVFLGPKASPMFHSVSVVLTRNADGSFVCAGEHHVAGERLTLRGAGPGDASPVWLTLKVQG